MAAVTHPFPEQLRSLYVGRILYKEADGRRVRGETHSYKEFFQDGPTSINKSYWVQWEDGQRVDMPLMDVEQCASEEFVTSSWMPPEITEWQKAGWDVERVDKEHVRCVTAFQEAMSGPSGVPNRAMGGATAADGLSSKSTARENPPEPPREREQGAQAPEAQPDQGVEETGTSGSGSGDMSGAARPVAEERCYRSTLRDFDAHGTGSFWRQKAREAFEACEARQAAGGGELEGAQQAQPAEWAAAGDTSTVLGTGARSGAPTLPHAPVLPRQSNVNVAWRARHAPAATQRGGRGDRGARDASCRQPDAEQAGSSEAAAADRAEAGGAGGRAHALSEAIPEWPSESAAGACAPYTQRTFSRRCKYPDKHCMALGDMPAKEWVAKEKAGQLPGGEYVVSEILDERWNAEDECREFIVKWKGFELHPSQWISVDDLDECAALDAWEKRHPPAGPPRKRPRKHAAAKPPQPTAAARKGTRRSGRHAVAPD